MESERKTFRELFCAKHGIAPDRFERKMLRRTLHRKALVLYPVWKVLLPGCFSPDIQFIRSLGDCRSALEARDVFEDFASKHKQESFARRVLKIRVSRKEALHIAKSAFPARSTAAVPGR